MQKVIKQEKITKTILTFNNEEVSLLLEVLRLSMTAPGSKLDEFKNTLTSKLKKKR